jgi:MOSC domain-containing protein YiiM
MKLVSLRIGKVQKRDSAEGSWETATYKEEVRGRILLGESGLVGDEQADRVNHGGRDKAVLVYEAEHYSRWKAELNLREFGLGSLGENLCVTEGSEAVVCLGDRYRIGQALVEVSQPRQPCWKQARRWGVKDLVLRIVESGRTGWYLRVLANGEVGAGMELELVERPRPDWPVERANKVFHHGKGDRGAMEALLAVEPLADSWKRTLARRLKELG